MPPPDAPTSTPPAAPPRASLAPGQLESSLVTLLQHSPDALIALDLQGNVTAWLGGAEAMLGHRADDILGRPGRTVLPPALDLHALLAALAAQPTVTAEAHLTHRDGHPVLVETRASLLRDERGEPAGVLGLHRDLSGRRRAEAQIAEDRSLLLQLEIARQEAEAERLRFRDLILQAPVPIAVLVGPDLTVDLANAPYERLVGRAGLVGRPFREVFPELVGHPVEGFFARVQATGETCVADEFLVPIDRTGAGVVEPTYFTFTISAVRDGAGRISGVMVVAVDATPGVQARQQAQALAAVTEQERAWLHAVLDRLPTPVVFAETVTARVLFANRAAEALWGHEPMPRADSSAQFDDLYQIEDASGRRLAAAETPTVRAARGEELRGLEVRWVTPRGAVPLLVDATTLPAMAGHEPVVVVTFQDTSALKRSEAERRQQTEALAAAATREREWMQAVLDQVPTPLVFVTPGTAVITFTNRAADALWSPDGIPRGADRQSYERSFDLADRDGRPLPPEATPAARAARGEEVRDLEVRWRTPVGDLPLLVDAATIPPTAGHDAVAVLVMRDVSAIKRIERALDESRRLFEALFDHLPAIAWSSTADGQIDLRNRRWFEYFGPLADPDDWRRVHHPDYYDQVLAAWQRAMAAGEPFEMEFPLRNQEGVYHWFLTRVNPLRDESGAIVRWFGMNANIDDQLRAQQRQQYLARVSAAVAATTDDHQAIEQAVVLAVPLFADGCVADYVRDDGRPEHVEARPPPSSPPLSRAVPVSHPEAPALLRVPLASRGRALGSLVFHRSRTSGRPRFSDDDRAIAEEVARLLSIAIDSNRQQKEREALIDALARSNQELDQFAYVASHDLKAPLRGIANLSHWIEEDLGEAVNAETRQNLTLLRGRVQRLEGLIDGILSYSRAGRVRDKSTPVDVGALLREILELLDPPPPGRVEVRGPLPTVMAEKVPLQQVFMNLVSNAIKYARRPDVLVTVQASAHPSHWEFVVTDNGPGIAPQFHERIWGIFQTLESRDKVEGTGIGLSVVKKIVETRGGRVWVISDLGQGAAFHFTWPRAPLPPGTEESS